MNSAFEWSSRHISLDLLAVLGVGLVISILLLIYPINGLGDNGEYLCVLNSDSLYRVNDDSHDSVVYFVKDFSVIRYFNETTTHSVSAQQFFITVAIWFSKLFYSQTLFDTRLLGFVYLSCLLVSIYILVRGLTEDVSLRKNYLISLLVIFILGDTSYTVYFNSFYTEAASFLLSVSVLAFSVYFCRVTKLRTWFRRIVLVILAQAVVLLTGTTRQEYLLIIGVIIVGLGFFVYLLQHYQRLSMTAFLITLIGFTALAAFIVPNNICGRNVHHNMTCGVMKGSRVPDKWMPEGEISPQHGLQKGRSHFEEYSPVSPTSGQMKKNSSDEASLGWVLLNHLNYPFELWQGPDSTIPNAYLVKPSNVRNFRKMTGHAPLE